MEEEYPDIVYAVLFLSIDGIPIFVRLHLKEWMFTLIDSDGSEERAAKVKEFLTNTWDNTTEDNFLTAKLHKGTNPTECRNLAIYYLLAITGFRQNSVLEAHEMEELPTNWLIMP